MTLLPAAVPEARRAVMAPPAVPPLGAGAGAIVPGSGQIGGSGGNGAGGLGGALDLVAGTVNVTNCTLADLVGTGSNVAAGGAGGQGGAGGGTDANHTPANGGAGGAGGNAQGGAIHISSGTLTLVNTTIATNLATAGAGGPGGLGATSAASNGSDGATGNALGGGADASGGTVQGLNTILAENGTDTGHLQNVYGSFASLGNNLVGNGTGSSGFGATDLVGTSSIIDPKLGPLEDNGGPTFTMALLTGSPAINGGTSAHNAPTTDQRGAPRDSAPDIGAFEAQPFHVNPTVLPAGTAGAAYNQTITISGGMGTVTLNVTNVSGPIPGLTIPSSGARQPDHQRHSHGRRGGHLQRGGHGQHRRHQRLYLHPHDQPGFQPQPRRACRPALWASSIARRLPPTPASATRP